MLGRRSALQIQQSVVFALLMRELQTRFGKYRLGYMWALLEPVMHVTVLALLFGVIFKRTVPDIDFPVYLITGIVPWLLFSGMISRGTATVTSNEGLFAYRQVKPVDALLARMLLEGVIYFAAYVILLVAAAWIGYTVAIEDPLGVFAALVLLYLFTFGVTLVFSVIAALYPETLKFMPLLMRPLYFCSGIFFSLASVPQAHRHFLTWNPLLHALELSRDAFFSSYHTVGGSWLYLSFMAVTSLCFGLACYRQNAVRILAT